MQYLGRGSKRQLVVDFDLVNPRLGTRRGRTKRENRIRPRSSRQDIQSNIIGVLLQLVHEMLGMLLMLLGELKVGFQ